MAIKVIFDDGSAKRLAERMPTGEQIPVKVRPRGFFLLLPDGREFQLPISFMRVSETKPLQDLLNEVFEVKNAAVVELADTQG